MSIDLIFQLYIIDIIYNYIFKVDNHLYQINDDDSFCRSKEPLIQKLKI